MTEFKTIDDILDYAIEGEQKAADLYAGLAARSRNREIQEATGAEIIMHSADALFFDKPEVKNYFSMLGLEASPPAALILRRSTKPATGVDMSYMPLG